jgi:hypothetical protein
MTNVKMHAIEVEDTPMLLQGALAPGFKLLGQRLVETTNRTGTGRHSQQRLGDFPNFVRACPGDKHPRRALLQCVVHSDCNVQMPACGIALHDLGGL